MIQFTMAVGAATLAWFLMAAILFFNPIVDRMYREEEEDPAVKVLPQSPATIGKILLAVLVQCIAWAFVYTLIQSSLPASPVMKGLTFGLIIVLVKLLPRDIDRVLLTTYPGKRMTIEFLIGIPCAFAVGFAFAYMF